MLQGLTQNHELDPYEQITVNISYLNINCDKQNNSIKRVIASHGKKILPFISNSSFNKIN